MTVLIVNINKQIKIDETFENMHTLIIKETYLTMIQVYICHFERLGMCIAKFDLFDLFMNTYILLENERLMKTHIPEFVIHLF
jgi:hypothetical protein